MEIKKSERASLENKRLLFVEIGMALALGIVLFAFEYSSKDKKVAVLDAGPQEIIEEEMVPSGALLDRTLIWAKGRFSVTLSVVVEAEATETFV